MKNRTCYYFDDITKIEYFNFDILLDKKSCVKILIHEISYITLIGAKLLCNRFDKVDGLI